MPTNPDHVVPVLEPTEDDDTRRAIDEVRAHVWGQVNDRCPPEGGLSTIANARLTLALDFALTLVAGLTAQGYKLQRKIAEFERVLNEIRMERRIGN
jgi:hypothetical protein